MREETEQGPSAEALFEEVALLQGEVAEIQQAQKYPLGIGCGATGFGCGLPQTLDSTG